MEGGKIMPAGYEYDPDRGLVLSRYYGIVTDDDVVRETQAIAGDQRIGPETRQLLDLVDVERADVSPQLLLTAVAVRCSEPGGYGPNKLAVVMKDEALSDMLHTYMRATKVVGSPLDMHVFSTREEAMAWLNTAEDEAPAAG